MASVMRLEDSVYVRALSFRLLISKVKVYTPVLSSSSPNSIFGLPSLASLLDR